jgi:uncharacterized membrane protein YqjE
MDRGSASSEPPPQAEPLVAGIKGWFHDGLELLRVRLELLGLEAAHHAHQLAHIMALALAVAFLGCLGLAFVSVLLTVLLWDTHRVLALTIFSVIFTTLAVVGFWLLKRKMRESVRWFEATVHELGQDVERLKS